ncbi:MAG TPA: SRPBCC family protein [Planktothrix sp.]
MKKILNSIGLVLMAQATLCFVQPNMVQAAPTAKPAENEVPVVEENVDGKTFSVSRTIVHAHPEAVWQVLTDYSGAPAVFPMLKKCQVLEDHGTTKVVKHRVAPSGLVGQFEYTVEIKETPCKSMEWHRVAGDFKEVDGYWKLEPLDGGRNTLVTYSSHVNGGMFMPAMLIKRQSRIDMPNVMASLRHQAETIGNNTIAGRPSTSHLQ